MKFYPEEIKTLKYWIHLGIIGAVVLFILQTLKGGNMFNLENLLLSIPLLGLGDIVSHTLLKLR